MKNCSPEGRDCIENKLSSTFNCSVACEGMYADVQWKENIAEAMEEAPVEDEMDGKFSGRYGEELTRLVYINLKKEIETIKGSISMKGDEHDRQKYKKLISEYRQFKKNKVQHFRFDSAAQATTFGKPIPIFLIQIKFKTDQIL